MPQALAQVTFPVTLQWSLTQLQEPHWLQYVCQLLEMSLTRVMRFEQSKVGCLLPCCLTKNCSDLSPQSVAIGAGIQCVCESVLWGPGPRAQSPAAWGCGHQLQLQPCQHTPPHTGGGR